MGLTQPIRLEVLELELSSPLRSHLIASILRRLSMVLQLEQSSPFFRPTRPPVQFQLFLLQPSLRALLLRSAPGTAGLIREIRAWRRQQYKVARIQMHGMLLVQPCPQHFVLQRQVPVTSLLVHQFHLLVNCQETVPRRHRSLVPRSLVPRRRASEWLRRS
jgi:hypothetical protein